eukprot:COSAG04_NODE_6281_length_1366_cov_1.806630_2_plen_46_part_00
MIYVRAAVQNVKTAVQIPQQLSVGRRLWLLGVWWGVAGGRDGSCL